MGYRIHDDEEWEEEREDEDYDVDEDETDNTVQCPFCKREIYEEAEQCPHCEKYISDGDYAAPRRPWWFYVIIGLLLFLMLDFLFVPILWSLIFRGGGTAAD